jgi:hypothetical protein
MHYELHARYSNGVSIQIKYLYICGRDLFSHGYWSKRNRFLASRIDDVKESQRKSSDKLKFSPIISVTNNQNRQVVCVKNILVTEQSTVPILTVMSVGNSIVILTI